MFTTVEEIEEILTANSNDKYVIRKEYINIILDILDNPKKYIDSKDSYIFQILGSMSFIKKISKILCDTLD